MLRHKAYRFRIYPNKKQEMLIVKTIGCSRFVYNYFLDMWNKTYSETGKGLTYASCSKKLTELKKQSETEWLREVDKFSLQNSLRHLSDSFSRFFKRQNNKPTFKRKNHPIQSYKTQFTNNNIAIVGRHIKLPKLGFVKFAKSREPQGRIIQATIRRNPSGKFFVSLLCEENIKPFKKTNTAVGIDLGIHDFAVFSDGRKKDNHRFTAKMEKKLKREQRKLSRRAHLAKKNGIHLSEAKNYQKQKKKVARLHEKVFHQRTDFLNKLTTDIIKNHDVICIEDLHTKGMLRNRKLAKSISDVSWSSFVAKLKYKAEWYGREVIDIDRWFPSSKKCSTNDCDYIAPSMPLNTREWTCPRCHTTHDRDINASKNILAEGLRLHSLT
ncbi:IS200/IS605 family element RNA-guided endonuclease TnpB [Alteribacillus iranensis]|uniref:Putative transposase n=1 Tax=Alteribacillus iranensis TaxID=930128 RepID=A0A1I2DLG2_9BACI|nr:IS200/IS605 family element RNA-guided endonuclease TnpB [Alteribacillus iranensis]SFE81414.1 putative transposase [Alteribacillus iranensis]